MRKITFVYLLLITVSALQAQVVLTQSSSQEIENHTFNCMDESLVTSKDSKYFRYFNLKENSIEGFKVLSVQFGVQSLILGAKSTGFPINIRVYTTSAQFPAGFPDEGYTLLAEKQYSVKMKDVKKIVTVPLETTVADSENLLVEIGYNTSKTSGKSITLGSNAASQTGISYFLSKSCDIPLPVDINTVKNERDPDSNIIINVIGEKTLSSATFLSDDAKAVLFPNPTSGIFKITVPEEKSIRNATLLDINGRRHTINLSSEGEADISGFENGVYFLYLETNRGMSGQKIIKQRQLCR